MNREAHTAGAVAYPHGDHLRAAVARGAATFEGSTVVLRTRRASIAFPGKAFRPPGTAPRRFDVGGPFARFLAAWGPPDTQADYTRMEAP